MEIMEPQLPNHFSVGATIERAGGSNGTQISPSALAVGPIEIHDPTQTTLVVTTNTLLAKAKQRIRHLAINIFPRHSICEGGHHFCFSKDPLATTNKSFSNEEIPYLSRVSVCITRTL